MTRKDTLKRKADTDDHLPADAKKMLHDAVGHPGGQGMKGGRLSSKNDTSIPHQSWLNMIYPWGAENVPPGAEFGGDEEINLEAAIKAKEALGMQGHHMLGNGSSSSSVHSQVVHTGPAQRLYWSTEMDELLKEAVALHGTKKWVAVAQHVAHGTDNNQCLNRWTTKVDPVLVDRRRGGWTQEEEHALTDLVENDPNMILKELKNNTDCYNWKLIGERLNRTRQDCKGKWKNIQYSRLKTGPFSPEEDAVIIRRVTEWQDKGSGLWVALERELGRPGRRIRERFKKL